jgi:hypothetical protein
MTNRYVQKQLDATVARIPKAAAAADAARADLQYKYEKDGHEADLRKAGVKTWEGPKVTVSSVEGDRGGGAALARANRPTETEIKYAVLAKGVLDELKDIEKLPPLTGAELVQMQTDSLRSASADKKAESEGQVTGIAIELGREVGAVPRSKYSSLSENAQKVANAYDNAGEKLFRILTGAGMPADEARRMVAQALPAAGDKTPLAAMKHKRLARTAEDMLAIAGVTASARLNKGPEQPAKVEQQTPAQKRYTEETTKQIAADKRDFTQQRRDIAEARQLLKSPKASPAQRAAAQRYLDQFGAKR